MNGLFAIAWGAMFVFGQVLGLPGAVLGLPEVAERIELSLVDRGTLISSLFFGLLTGSAASGPFVDRLGRRRVLAGSLAVMAVCLVAFVLASSVPLAIAALAALGVASAGVNTASNALVSELFPGARAHRMNMISLGVGLGGLTLAAGAALADGRIPWQRVVLGSAALAAGVAVAAALIRDARADAAVPPGNELLPPALRQASFAALGLLLVCSAANEVSMAGWTSAYLVDSGASPTAATWGLAGHWLGLIVGRVLLGGLVEHRKERAIMAAALAAAAGVASMVTVRAPVLTLAMPFAIGVAISIVTPTALAIAGDRYPQLPGTVFGVLMTLAQAGAMIAPILIGFIAVRAGIRTGLATLVLTSLAIAVLAASLARTAAAAATGERFSRGGPR